MVIADLSFERIRILLSPVIVFLSSIVVIYGVLNDIFILVVTASGLMLLGAGLISIFSMLNSEETDES